VKVLVNEYVPGAMHTTSPATATVADSRRESGEVGVVPELLLEPFDAT